MLTILLKLLLQAMSQPMLKNTIFLDICNLQQLFCNAGAPAVSGGLPGSAHSAECSVENSDYRRRPRNGNGSRRRRNFSRAGQLPGCSSSAAPNEDNRQPADQTRAGKPLMFGYFFQIIMCFAYTCIAASVVQICITTFRVIWSVRVTNPSPSLLTECT